MRMMVNGPGKGFDIDKYECKMIVGEAAGVTLYRLCFIDANTAGDAVHATSGRLSYVERADGSADGRRDIFGVVTELGPLDGAEGDEVTVCFRGRVKAHVDVSGTYYDGQRMTASLDSGSDLTHALSAGDDKKVIGMLLEAPLTADGVYWVLFDGISGFGVNNHDIYTP